MSVSEEKQKANEENAKKSTGPKTEQGKKISSQNALKHGLFANNPVISNPKFNESQEEYDLLKSALVQELKPSSILQSHLVQKIVDSLWRYRRVINAEKREIDASEKNTSMEIFKEYFAAGGLTRMQYDPNAMTPQQYAEKRSGSTNEPKSPPIPSGNAALNLSRYEMRLDRQLHRACRLLRLLQRLETRKPRKKRKK